MGVTQASISFKNDFKISQSLAEFETQGRQSIIKHTGGGRRGEGLARRSNSRTQNIYSKIAILKKVLKSYPLNIFKEQSESSKISNLGQIFIFTENCMANYYPYESF